MTDTTSVEDWQGFCHAGRAGAGLPQEQQAEERAKVKRSRTSGLSSWGGSGKNMPTAMTGWITG